jgi:site-specific DNA-methyltransferase (adenine-specific)
MNDPELHNESHTKYGVILSDCPWRYRNFKEASNGAAAAHYQTMELEDLKKIPVSSWAAENCIHFMWTTWPHLAPAIDLMKIWGFEYKTGLPWIKTVNTSIRSGIGFFTRSVSELLLIGTKGNPARLTARNQTPVGLLVEEDRVFYAPIGKHSKKPEELQDWIEKTYSGPMLEIFSTRDRPAWTCWGYSTGYKLSEVGVTQVEK